MNTHMVIIKPGLTEFLNRVNHYGYFSKTIDIFKLTIKSFQLRIIILVKDNKDT